MALRVPTTPNIFDRPGAMNIEWVKFFNDLVAAAPLILAAYPVGAIFLGAVATNPATLLGFGTWVAIAAGRVLVGLNAVDPDFDTVGETGGAKTVAAAGTVSAPTFTGNAVAAASTAATPDLVAADVTAAGVSPVTTATGTVSAPTFTGSPTSVVQPYYVVYMWRRTA